MNTRILEYLLALEKYESFSRAADFCGISQPTLSVQIKKFEDELGISLIERGKRRTIFTQAGQNILEKARPIVRGTHEILQMAELWNDPYSGSLTLGAFPTLAPYLFPNIVQDLVDSYPNLKFYLIEEKTEVLIQKLKGGEIDAAFLALPENHEELEFAELFEEEFLLAVPKKHEWSFKGNVNAPDLEKENLLLLDEGHCLRDQALDFCSQNGGKERVDFRASSMPTLLQMISMGNGISLIPECAVNTDPNISFIRFKGQKPNRKIGLFWRKTSVRKQIFEELVDDFTKSLYD